jgi:hypothetical protein
MCVSAVYLCLMPMGEIVSAVYLCLMSMHGSVSAVYLNWCLWVRLYQQSIFLISLGTLCKIDVDGCKCPNSLSILMSVGKIVSAVHLYWWLWVILYQLYIYVWCLLVVVYQQSIHINVCGWYCISSTFILMSVGGIVKADYLFWYL